MIRNSEKNGKTPIDTNKRKSGLRGKVNVYIEKN